MGGGYVFFPIAVGILLLEGLAFLALILTGNWTSEIPVFLQKLNPLFMYAEGLRHPILPETLFRNWSHPYGWFTLANLYLYSVIQFAGIGLILDFAKNKK